MPEGYSAIIVVSWSLYDFPMAAFVRSDPADDALLLQFLYMLGNGSPYNSKRICHLLGCHFRVFSDKLKEFLCTFL